LDFIDAKNGMLYNEFQVPL